MKGFKNETRVKGGSDRAKKMFSRDCQLMGLTWLLAKNKTAYIPTVSAVLRAMMYSAHPHESKCSPDQENMPLAVDSLQFESGIATSWPSNFWVTLLPLIILLSLVWKRVRFSWIGSLLLSLSLYLFLLSVLFLGRFCHGKLSYQTKSAMGDRICICICF